MKRVFALAVCGAVMTAGSSAGAQSDDASELLARYAPVLELRAQTEACGEGEPYFPVAVDAILGREDVVLRDGSGDVITAAPTAADLARGGEDLALDLPGNALDPGCSYEEWFDSLAAEPAVYGRVVPDGDQLVVQYWLFWVYNDWNDRHEGDWEMIQLGFDAATATEALDEGPSVYAYAQHEGSEYARVGENDDKVRLVGGRAVVYPAEGSHAAYFSSSRWFGKSGATGFGCDDTRAPLVQVQPGVITLPDGVPTEGEFAWLSFAGHWGERQPLFNDGPTGPVSKTQWGKPVEWVDVEGRDTAVAIPFAGSRATGAFCNLAEKGSLYFLRLLDQPVVAILLLVALITAVVSIVRYSSRGLLGRAARTWRRYARRLLRIGALVLVGAVAAALAQYALVRWTRLGDLVDLAGGSSPWVLPIVGAVGAVVAVPVVALVVGATLTPAEDGTISLTTVRRSARWAAGLGTMLVLVILGVTSIVLVPLALYLVSRRMLGPVASAKEQLAVRDGMRRSRHLIRGHGWRAFGLVLTLVLVVALAGVAGALVLLLTSASFVVANVIVALAAVVLVPYIALVLAHFYDDLTTPA
ncbi:MAG TPA: hypothetical protein VFP09_05940 [Desertimonas sp.]|nr:hypothetical protein [Desertimonas sp.]